MGRVVSRDVDAEDVRSPGRGTATMATMAGVVSSLTHLNEQGGQLRERLEKVVSQVVGGVARKESGALQDIGSGSLGEALRLTGALGETLGGIDALLSRLEDALL